MDRSGWLTWAWAATLIGAVVAANGFVVLGDMVAVMTDASREAPPPAPWFGPSAAVIAAAAVAIAMVAVLLPSHAWAKTRAKRRQPAPAAPEDTVEDERISAPPGFGGPAVRTRRAGAGALLGWSALGLIALAGGATLAVFALLTLQQTSHMDGRGFKQAVLWGQLLRFAALPLLAIGAIALGYGWGRWFPLGALEVVKDEAPGQPRPMHMKWQRQE